MPSARLFLIGIVAFTVCCIQPGWFGWLAQLEWHVFPPPERNFGPPPFTALMTGLGVPLVRMLGFMFGVATVLALVANLLIRMSRVGCDYESLSER